MVTETSYTPGPWSITSPNLITGQDGIPIVEVLPADKIWGITNERDHANARLIAAAPDLLAVVKEAVQAYAINEGQEDDEIDYTRLNNALLKGKQAIAKAEGREG